MRPQRMDGLVFSFDFLNATELSASFLRPSVEEDVIFLGCHGVQDLAYENRGFCQVANRVRSYFHLFEPFATIFLAQRFMHGAFKFVKVDD
jgi:hypothetical protein